MEIIKMDQIEGKVNKRGVTAKQLIKHENTTVMNLVLKPGDVVPEHNDVFTGRPGRSI
ncbi:MAG: hypothetical protein PWQ96_482 [Clostridia bacterium]|jgi:quercetin dioxygenase-like cupin family protein|nr:Cupin 2 conserved barrel domain protein [Clostridiales bacterium]MDK2984840.1 hypothetical protein [Clostridia bacterium]